MLEKDYTEGLFVAHCDLCRLRFKRIPKEYDDKAKASEAIKQYDWVIAEYDGRIEHYCPYCVKTKQKEVLARKKKAMNATTIKDAPPVIYGGCTLCGGDYVLRESKYGKFYGCQRFPKCYGRANIELALKTKQIKDGRKE